MLGKMPTLMDSVVPMAKEPIASAQIAIGTPALFWLPAASRRVSPLAARPTSTVLCPAPITVLPSRRVRATW